MYTLALEWMGRITQPCDFRTVTWNGAEESHDTVMLQVQDTTTWLASPA